MAQPGLWLGIADVRKRLHPQALEVREPEVSLEAIASGRNLQIIPFLA